MDCVKRLEMVKVFEGIVDFELRQVKIDSPVFTDTLILVDVDTHIRKLMLIKEFLGKIKSVYLSSYMLELIYIQQKRLLELPVNSTDKDVVDLINTRIVILELLDIKGGSNE